MQRDNQTIPNTPHFRPVRSHTCGALRETDNQNSVMLTGWVAKRRDLGGLLFIDLRDRYGLTQIVVDPADPKSKGALEELSAARNEFVLWVKGTVRLRPEGMRNSKMATGSVEVLVEEAKILAQAETPPFQIEDETTASENLRLKYRYLDLRRPSLQKNLLVRHKMLSIIRNHLDQMDFCEVETPILYKSTPEGARDFIVPSRLNPNTFYALPQSPQTLKQLLMVSGMDRYYQIARCFRDEDLRADRQPEFSQIDVEASFIDEEVFFPIFESMMKKLWKEILHVDLKTPFRRMKYAEAMTKYGSDKPDLRFGLEIEDLSPVFKNTEFQAFKKVLEAEVIRPHSVIKGTIRCIVVRDQNGNGVAEKFSRKDLDDLQESIKPYGAKGLLWIKVQETQDGKLELQSPAAKFFKDEEKSALQDHLKLKKNDLVLVVADAKPKTVFDALGTLRNILAAKLNLVPVLGSKEYLESPNFMWLTHFPLFEYDDELKRYFACHHPFTSPRPEFFDDFVKGDKLDTMEASAYDLVLNGVEVGGGSLRIYRSDVQSAMFRNLGMSDDEAKEKFGFFLEALKYGTPPHGGIAFGVERLAAILCGVGPIRDVMAFPKTQRGHCLMSESPSSVSEEQLGELQISLVKKESHA